VDGVLAEQPHLRSRSLRQHLLRLHGLRVPRRQLDAYLKAKGLVESRQPTAEPEPRFFEAPRPLDMVQTDLMYVKREDGDGHFYVLTVLDDHSRMALASTVLEHQTGRVVLEAFRRVINQWGTPSRVLTDRGTQFIHWRGRTEFQEYVENELGAEHILARAQHPQTLGKIERFHATLRKEALKRPAYPSHEALQAELDGYHRVYNYQRPHQGLDGLTPADRFYGLAGPVTEKVLHGPSLAPGALLLTANLMGRRLVLAGQTPGQVQVLWDDGASRENPGAEPRLW
jgi:transposase InsO family protein